MKTTIVLLTACAWAASAADVPPPQAQIAGAVLAAPAELREGAAVLGYDAQGGRVQLRAGKNELICLTRIWSRSWRAAASCWPRR
jgi:hypothetical protein